MKRFLFNVRACLLENRRHTRLLVIVVFSMTIGLLAPCLMLGFFRTGLSQAATIHSPYADQTLACSVYAPPVPETALESLRDAEGAVSASARAVRRDMPAFWGDKSASATVSFVAPGYFDDFLAPKLVDGREMTDDELKTGAPVCVVEQSFLYNHGEIAVGDTLRLPGQELTVVGIVQAFSLRDLLFVPWGRMPDLGPMQQTLLLRYAQRPGDTGETLAHLQSAIPGIATSGPLAPKIQPENRLEASSEQLLWVTVTGLVAFGLVLLLYAVVNIILILVGKMQLRRRCVGIKLALGAGKADLFWGFFLENLIYTLLATLLLLPLAPFVSRYMPSDIAPIYDAPVYLLTFLLGALMSALVSWILTVRAGKQTVTRMLYGDQ